MKKGENGSVGLLRLLDSLGFHRSSRRMANFKLVRREKRKSSKLNKGPFLFCVSGIERNYVR
jgi:hypothetical protein